MTKNVRKYDAEFKCNAVSLYISSGKSYPILGKELGIPAATRLNKGGFCTFSANLWVERIHQELSPKRIWTSASWLYVVVVMVDLYSRKIIGLSMGKHITRELVISAFLQAMLMRGYPKALLYHSGRGSQYTSRAFQKLMKRYKINKNIKN